MKCCKKASYEADGSIRSNFNSPPKGKERHKDSIRKRVAKQVKSNSERTDLFGFLSDPRDEGLDQTTSISTLPRQQHTPDDSITYPYSLQENDFPLPASKAFLLVPKMRKSNEDEDATFSKMDVTLFIRERMLRELTRRLKDSQKMGSRKSNKQILAAAEKIEAHLFSTAPSLAAYQDQSTLQARFRALGSAMLHRRLQKAEAEAATNCKSTCSPAHRLQALKPEIARKVSSLIHQIELIQAGKPIRGASRTSFTGATVSTPSFHIRGQERVPKEVKDIFWEPTIVTAFWNTPVECLDKLPWPRLISQAQQSIQDFHKWIAQSKGD